MMADMGVIGLGVMGAALARNLIDHDTKIIGFEPVGDTTALKRAGDIPMADSLGEMLHDLSRPRVILMMVTAGAPVDAMINQIQPQLAPGDIIIDGGNSHFLDSQRRAENLSIGGLLFMGLGVSGGEAGARFGPAMMAGGAAEAVQLIQSLLLPIAAKSADGSPCFDHFGPAPAGHFVKMLHNAIEYGEMQLLAEIYGLAKYAGGQGNGDIADLFAGWSTATYGGYLVDVSAGVLRQADDQTDRDLIDQIAPIAGQKGTGRWAITAALDLGQAVPSLAAAVFARSLTARAGSQTLPGPVGLADPLTPEQLYGAFALAKLATYEQGFQVLNAAAESYDWPLDLPAVARVWRAGCILRGPLLETLARRVKNGVTQIFDASDFKDLSHLRRLLASASASGISVPVLAASLSYVEGLSSDRPTAQLIQGQRDAFGAHGFERRDQAGVFHGQWSPIEGA
jgi:6-phosphogluconate dehydrogenase